MKKHAAFTLIELILVITIIGILTSILVLNFNDIRHRQQLSLMADQALAMMQQARGDVRGGKVRTEVSTDGLTEEKIFLCEGAYFEIGNPPQFALADYDPATGLCDFDTFATELYGLATGDAAIATISVGDSPADPVWAFFSPPEGALVFYSADGVPYTGSGEIHFAHSSVPDLDISLQLSALTGLVSLSIGTNEE